MRRLYVKTPARNYTLFQNIFVVETFFSRNFSTRKFLKCLLTNYGTFWENKRLKKSIFGKKMIVFDWKYWKKKHFFFENLPHKNAFFGSKSLAQKWTKNFWPAHLVQKMHHYKSTKFSIKNIFFGGLLVFFSSNFHDFFLIFGNFWDGHGFR